MSVEVLLGFVVEKTSRYPSEVKQVPKHWRGHGGVWPTMHVCAAVEEVGHNHMKKKKKK